MDGFFSPQLGRCCRSCLAGAFFFFSPPLWRGFLKLLPRGVFFFFRLLAPKGFFVFEKVIFWPDFFKVQVYLPGDAGVFSHAISTYEAETRVEPM